MGIIYRFSVWVRSNFFIPDARAMWIKPSVKYLTKYVKEHPVDAIFTDGPPHTNTRIATLLKQNTGIPWLSDYQDPWSQVDYFQELTLTNWGLKKHLKQEQEAFQFADKITIVSPTWKKDLEKIGAKNIDVIYWGYDPEDYSNILPNKKISSKFSILHAGVMGFDRNPKALFQALSELIIELPDFNKYLSLEFLGQVDHSVKSTISQLGLDQFVNYPGNLIRKEAINQIFSAQILLLLLNQQPNAMGRVPGKLFEYLAAKRPILNLGPHQSDVHKLLTKTNTGTNFEYHDVIGIKTYLHQAFLKFKANQLQQPLNSDITEYTHEINAKKIAHILNTITN